MDIPNTASTRKAVLALVEAFMDTLQHTYYCKSELDEINTDLRTFVMRAQVDVESKELGDALQRVALGALEVGDETGVQVP